MRRDVVPVSLALRVFRLGNPAPSLTPKVGLSLPSPHRDESRATVQIMRIIVQKRRLQALQVQQFT